MLDQPIIAVTSGEPAGVGPELCLRLLAYVAEKKPPARLIVLADRQLMLERASALGFAGALRDWTPGLAPSAEALDVLHLPLPVPSRPGQLDSANAPYVLQLLDRALDGCRAGEFAAMVTAPVHKGVINDAGIPFTGHTEYLAEKTNTPRVVMMLAGGGLRVALATTHLPLKDVSAAITQDSLEQTIRILHADMGKKYGIAVPRILVAGLNPHAGEGGYLGREEIEVITPVLDRIDTMVLNSAEAKFVSGIEVHDEASARDCAEHLLRSGVRNVFLFVDDSDMLYCCEHESFFWSLPGRAEERRYTNGGASAALSALVWARREHKTQRECARYASAAAAMNMSQVQSICADFSEEAVRRKADLLQ